MVQMYHSLFKHKPIEGNVGSFQFGDIINEAAMNIHVQVPIWT